MYYLTKFCRICIRTGVQLTDIDTIDMDSIRFSEKLDVFIKMVDNNNKENLSREICLQCIKKLRISYDFQKLCQQSTKILQGYLDELISNKINDENFMNSELRVTLTPLHINNSNIIINCCQNNKGKILINRRKRISKKQRCVLLKKLLATKKNGVQKKKKSKSRKKAAARIENNCGGLKNIIEFTKNYNFGYKIDRYKNELIDSPLARLVNFTKTFFINNFTDFQHKILYLIENRNNLSDIDENSNSEIDDDDDDDEIMFNTIPQEEGDTRFEEVIVEPDIKIKHELIEFEDNSYSDNNSTNYYIETTDNKYSPRRIFIKQESNDFLVEQQQQQQQTSSVQLLDKLVDNLDKHKTFSQFNIRCRTRNNPYINPQLRQQFQLRSFQCKLCNRLFKSLGYLKAHISKIHA